MIPKICLFALLSALLSFLLERLGFRSGGLFALLCTLLMLCSMAESLGDMLGGIMTLANRAGITDAASCALRAVGLGYVFGFTADLCASLGEGAIASAVTVAGRVEIFLVAYPYFERMVALGAELLE